ncbi:hypothetical protein jhhlp_006252 [Lomentospora prolificans]|uniref:Flo11 n=1 Tax=Lomentospora prolificans TaxID=41688 RepID=A0A2N3N5E4_9PEZI|nr:hypothetical protein jhhlp_006252 [Lomentospora prolificans]
MSSAQDSTVSRPTSGVATPRSIRSRTHSISSDRPSLFAPSLMSPPLSVSPESAFIAASAASQIVTNDHDTHAAVWYDQHGIEPSGETALVTNTALQLVNNFLDQLLFNILSVSRSTALSALRPAVTEVLKPKLAKDAINQADEELREYLGGGDEDDLLLPHGHDSSRDWDLELVWKRTRLRCMVYSSLGDMEEEDEDYFMEQEGLEIGSDEQLHDVISPAVAIFLTSILEYMGEQALVVAGQGAYHRLQARLEKELRDGARNANDIADRVVVDDLDMDRVALDRTLGRLWRAWKKRIRSPTFDSRPFSRSSTRSQHFRQNSAVPVEHPLPELRPDEVDSAEAGEIPPQPDLDPEALAASVPLPVTERDVDEIEVPGLAAYSDDEEDDETEYGADVALPRPHSMISLPYHMPIGLAVEENYYVDVPAAEPLRRSNSNPHLPSVLIWARRRRLALNLDLGAVAPLPESPDDGELLESDVENESVGQPEDNIKQEVDDDIPAEDVPEIQGPDDIAEFEILTSSRVSIGGAASPSLSGSDVGHSRSSSRQATRPTSMSSPRLIEVSGPKSPVMRSHTEPEVFEQYPAVNGYGTQQERPQAVETIFRSPIASPVSRPTAERATRAGRTFANSAISEVEEDRDALSIRAESTPTSASLPTPRSANLAQAGATTEIKQTPVMFGSTSRYQKVPSPSQEHSQSGTKVTIISTSNSDPRFVQSASPEVPSKASIPNRSYPIHNQDRGTSVQKHPASEASPSSIGMVSVERPRTRAETSELPPISTNIAPRQIHTSGSSVSSSTTKLKPVRTSEESGSARPEDVARNFEQLIQSDETIQYTLTPEGMRDIDSSSLHNSPVLASKSRRSDDVKRINPNRSRSSSNSGSAKRVGGTSVEVHRNPSVRGQNGLSSHATNGGAPKLSGPVPRAPALGPVSSRGSNVQAREARVPRESIAEFADFIRSTGPYGGDNGPIPIRPSAGSISSAKNSIDTRRTSSASNRPRLLAREAIVDNREDNSDLIDFIRRGPSGLGDHRIPRAVAPFRTTMDSDQMSGAVGGKAVDATIPNIRYSQTSASVTDMAPSMHSSINSQSALLKNKPSYQTTSFDEEETMPMPKRKTRRVRDPYAIDFSDEEDDEIFGMPSMPAKSTKPAKEESLADFLRNYEPPPEPVQSMPPPQTKPKKKSSTSNLMNRFTRGSSSSSHSNKNFSGGSNTLPPLPRTNSTSGGKGYIPIQVNMPPGYDKYGPVDTSVAPKTSSPGAGTVRVPRRKFEPREAVSTQSSSGTSDLAAFLRSSGPPAAAAAGPRYGSGR